MIEYKTIEGLDPKHLSEQLNRLNNDFHQGCDGGSLEMYWRPAANPVYENGKWLLLVERGIGGNKR